MKRITVTDVARDLGISPQTVRVMAKRGLLPFVQPTNVTGKYSRYVVYPELYRKYVGGDEAVGGK